MVEILAFLILLWFEIFVSVIMLVVLTIAVAMTIIVIMCGVSKGYKEEA
jgi:hypothetical protein